MTQRENNRKLGGLTIVGDVKKDLGPESFFVSTLSGVTGQTFTQ